MKLKAYLKSNEGYFCLAYKITTIGREGCDLNIQSPVLDVQHAMIECSDENDCFILKDLNSTHGTFINDCRVQNASVRLASGDIIKLGGQTYEFIIDTIHQPIINYYPLNQRSNYQLSTGFLENVPNETQLPSIVPTANRAVWTQHINSEINSVPIEQKPITTSNVVVNSFLSGGITSRLGRPLSVGSVASSSRRSGGTVTLGPAAKGGWISSTLPNQQVNAVPNDTYTNNQQEQFEKSRLLTFESESARKDATIELLHQQLRATSQQQQHLHHKDSDLSFKLNQLQQEVENRQNEVATLKEQLKQLGENCDNCDVNTLRVELERVKKDKGITAGLMAQFQRDLSAKDSTISRLTREIEKLKKDLRSKDDTIASINKQFTEAQDDRKHDEENKAREKELKALRSKFKSVEQSNCELNDLIKLLKTELDASKSVATREMEAQKQTVAELEKTRNELLDVQRAERMARVDSQEAVKHYERLRSKVMQLATSINSVKLPAEDEVKDDELIGILKTVVDDCKDLRSQMVQFDTKLSVEQNRLVQVKEEVSRFASLLTACSSRLQAQGRLSSVIKEQVRLLLAESVTSELQGVKDAFMHELAAQLSWTEIIDEALEECGVSVKLSDKSPAHHIRELLFKSKKLLEELEEQKKRYAELNEKSCANLEQQMEKLNREWQIKVSAAVEKVRSEMVEENAKAVEATRQEAEERSEKALMDATTRITELTAQLNAAQNACQEDAENKERHASTESDALKRLAEAERREVLYQQQIDDLLASKEKMKDVVIEVHHEKENGGGGGGGVAAAEIEKELSFYKEQVRQHSVTICSMEERLSKVNRENKDLKNQIVKVKEECAHLSQKSAKKTEMLTPKVIVQRPTAELAALERINVTLRQDNATLKLKLKEQHDLCESLRRDLTGAAARLSDIRGELTEAQKEELENGRTQIVQVQDELQICRNQLEQLSGLVEHQKVDLQSKDGSLKKFKEQITHLQEKNEEYASKLKEFETSLSAERSRAEGLLGAEQQEGRISAEMSALGHQCRGERHLQVMAHQKEALSELRRRIKQAEHARPSVPTQDQAVQQVMLLKKELSELRARQALMDTRVTPAVIQLQATAAAPPPPVVNRDSRRNADLEAERNAHRQTLTSLELSEQSYCILLRAMASILDLESIEGLRSLAHLPHDEAERLKGERDTAVELLSQRIQLLKERLARKEELLHGYESDLARLRQAEELAARKNEQVNELVQAVRGRNEESELLREALHRTKDMLHQEKRLNTAIKQKKTFHLENEHLPPTTRAKPHCPIEDLSGKESERRKLQKERKKRHDYEIQSLQNELAIREKDLCRATSRINNLETTLGVQKKIQN